MRRIGFRYVGCAFVFAALLSMAVLFASQGSAAEYKAEYKLSTVVGKAFPWGAGAERWADLVREKTGGRINIKMYPGASLVGGDQTKEFTALRQGAIDVAVGSTINWSPQIKELNLFSLPFLMPDYKAIDALTQGEVGREMFKILAGKDVVPLAWGENGFRELSNSKRPVRAPGDLKGLKLRVVGSPLYLDIFTALGANPTQMSWADAVPALASGAVDGQENPFGIFTGAKLDTRRESEVSHRVGLRGGPADFRRQPGGLEELDAGGPEGRPGSRRAGRQGRNRHGEKRAGCAG